MNDSTLSSVADLSPALVRRLDEVCNRFETAWRGGCRPCLDDYLEEADELYPVLVRELILLDVHYRHTAGERPRAEDYQSRCAILGANWLARTLTELDACTATTASSDTTHSQSRCVPPLAFGDYELLDELGRGGMGVVYRARQTQLNRVVALKRIKSGALAGEEEWTRFFAEAEAVARVRHPGIVQVYDFGTHEGLPYFSLEFCDGGSLADRLDGTPLPTDDAATLVERLARTVQAAHDAGIVHRDLKPANVLLSFSRDAESSERSDPSSKRNALRSEDSASRLNECSPKITDFGLAKRVEGGGLTQTGVVVGTPSYMPPEQAQGNKEVGPLADVYALGAILYECLTGRPPFKAATVMDTLLQVVGEDPVPVRQLQAKAPADLETICHKCLQKEPRNRYSSAQALADDLERYLEGRPILARPVGRAERFSRWCRREPIVAGLLAAVFVVLVAGVTVSGVLAVRAERKATEAEKNAQIGKEEANRAEHEAEAARRNEKEAQRDRKIAVAVNEFLREDLLGQADIGNQPFAGEDVGRDPNITVAELLGRAAKAIEGKFKEQPETEAAIRFTIGNAYLGLGKDALALPHLERSTTLRENRLGADHPDTLASKNNLAILHMVQGHFEKAERLYLEVLRAEKTVGANHTTILACKDNLASIHHERGEYAKAEQLLLEVLRVEEKKLGVDHPRSLATRSNLARVYRSQGLSAKAESMVLEILRLREQKLGHDHPDTLLSKHNLATLYMNQRQYEKAEAMHLEVLKIREAKLGPDHPSTLESKSALGRLYRDQRRYDKAEPLFLEVANLHEKTLGPENLDRLQSKFSLATLYREQRKYDKAEPLFLEVVRLREKKLGPVHPDTLTSKNGLARLYDARRMPDKAEPLFLEVARLREKKLGPDHPDTVSIKHELAFFYKKQRKYDLAEPLYLEVLRLSEKSLGANHRETLTIKHNLARLYQDQGIYEKAEPLFLEAIAGRAKALGPPHRDTLAASRNLAILYKAWGKFDKAEPLLRRRLEVLAAQLGAESVEAAGALVELVDNLFSQKKYAEAEKTLREHLGNGEKRFPDHWLAFNTRSLLGETLRRQKKYTEAEPLLLQGYEGLEKRATKIPREVRPARLKEALERLVHLYDATGNQSEAARWRQKLNESKKPVVNGAPAKK